MTAPSNYIRAISGGAKFPEHAVSTLDVNPTQFQAGGYSYLVADLGKESLVKKITFNCYYYGVQDTLTISYRSFAGSDSENSEKIIKTIELQNECSFTGSTANPFSIPITFYGRLIFFKVSGLAQINIAALSVDIGITDSPYASGETTAINYDYLQYDENLKTAPSQRISIMRAGNNVAGLYLGGITSPSTLVPVTQISFNAITTKATLFKLQYRTSNILFDSTITTSDASWTDIKTFRVIDYDRLATTEISDDGIDSYGTVVMDSSLPAAKFANNGLVGWMFRPDTYQEYSLNIIESWTDGTNNYFRVNANLNELGIVPRTKYFIERPNVITFPATSATILQLTQISGGETKINSLKAYVNLIDSTTGNAVAPTTGAEQLEWALQIESI
jgi:hypothetical protein